MSLIDKQLIENEENRRVRPPHTLYATDLTHPCTRQITYNITYDRPKQVETLRIFNAGRKIEDDWLQRLEREPNIKILKFKKPNGFYSTQIQAYYNFTVNGLEGMVPYTIHGRVDALCIHEDRGLVLHEVKSIKNAYFVKKYGPREDHVSQIQYYMNILGVEHGQIDYLDKIVWYLGNNPDYPNIPTQIDTSFRIEKDQQVFADIILRAVEVATLLETLGTAEANPKAWSGRVCEYCSYRDLCEKEES